MIVRDSARTLPACLASIAPWVDEMVVVDTGSGDDTRSLAAQFGARVFDFPWCDDFAVARNESLRHATGDWLFWMDSDDTISAENGHKLRALADAMPEPSPTAYVMQVHCPGPPDSADCTVVDHVKMFRNGKSLRFEGRIHEQILPAIRRINGTVEWTDIYVTHSGTEHSVEAKRRKQQRDLRLLEMELHERPAHPFVLFNLGMTYADMEDVEQAIEYLQQCLLVSSADESHVRKAYALLVGCLTHIGRDAEAYRILGRGRELFPDDPELLFRLGILEHRANRIEEAIEAYQDALEHRQQRFFSSRDHGITGYKARHNLAGIYHEIGRRDLAELQWRVVLDEEPAYRDGWRGFVDVLVDQQKYTTLEVEIESARKREMPKDAIVYAQARCFAKCGDVEAAIRILDEEAASSGLSLELLRLKCQLLFECSTTDRAVIALEELCRRAPADGAAWHNLGTAYHKAGCLVQAVASYQTSLNIRPGAEPTLLQLDDAQRALDRKDTAHCGGSLTTRTLPPMCRSYKSISE